MLFVPQLVASWEREAGRAMHSAWTFVWPLLWAEAELGLSDLAWATLPLSGSSALYFPHLCPYHSVHVCPSSPLDHHLIFLFPSL